MVVRHIGQVRYAAVRAAGWGGVGMWLASGMFPNGLHVSKPHVFDCYCPKALARMWMAIASNFVANATVNET